MHSHNTVFESKNLGFGTVAALLGAGFALAAAVPNDVSWRTHDVRTELVSDAPRDERYDDTRDTAMGNQRNGTMAIRVSA